ncbi:FUSC family protein [Rossellomorea aquimaris]|uniref:Putative membrane protein YccC n=1 Tax=Rossellomorea aquimaris TaxID=189382 RepID=A0A366ENX6_9BACI|nr:FUSC family protein [Rossellomorea aquimaris]RBP03175.1 putative membrane protein YccC [Rossellomorea aquimaris]
MKQLHRQHVWLGRILASDPGRKRFQQAGKATISLISAVFTMLFLLKLFDHTAITPAIVSGMVGMLGIFVVMDDTTAKKKVTTPLIGVAVAVGITLGSAFAHYSLVVNILLVGAIFSAFYFSRFAIRYFSMGMAGFMSIYISSILQLDVAHLSWFYIGIVIGVMYAFLYNFIIFKGSVHVLRRSMRSFHIQSNLTFTILMKMIEDPDTSSKRRKLLDRNVRRLNEYARIVAGDINENDLKKLWPGIEPSQLRLYVFDTEMLIQTLTDSLKRLKELDALEVTELRRLLVWVLRSLRDAEVLAQDYDPRSLEEAEIAIQGLRLLLSEMLNQEEKPEGWVYLLRRIESIANHVLEAAITIQESLKVSESKETDIESNDESLDEEKEDKPEEETRSLNPSTRKAIQALVAGTLAIIVGELIAPAQPYWVLLTTFIIQIGTESVGRTYMKAFQRSVGTVTGAILGFGAAKLVSGNSELEVFLLFVVLFLAFYLFTVSYTLMSLFITMLIAFMYDLLLGGISMQLMGARVIDTIAGAAIALSVSAFVFPKKTKDKVADAFDDFLEELGGYVSSYIKTFTDIEDKPLTDQAFDLDQKLQGIKDEAQSLLQRPGSMTRSGIGRWVTVVTAINYYAKHLLASSHRKVPAKVSDELNSVFQQTEEKITHNIETLRELLKEKESARVFWSLSEEREKIETLAPSRLKSQMDLIHHLYYVWKINQSIVALGEELGAEVKETQTKG